MESLLEGFKKHLKETPKEVLEQEFFEIDCRMEGIDHTLPNAKELLKRKRRIDKWKYKARNRNVMKLVQVGKRSFIQQMLLGP